MEKSKIIDLLSIPDSQKTKLVRELRRQMLQRVVEEKLIFSVNMIETKRNGKSCKCQKKKK